MRLLVRLAVSSRKQPTWRGRRFRTAPRKPPCSGQRGQLILKTQGRSWFTASARCNAAASKLTAIHNLVLVEYVVQGLAAIGRQRSVRPERSHFAQQLNLAMTQFLDSVKNLRGIEAYQLVCDSSNNNATTREQLREVIVDLFIVPTDCGGEDLHQCDGARIGCDCEQVTG
jgi:hypothetical protein